jgi:hypothetical protein
MWPLSATATLAGMTFLLARRAAIPAGTVAAALAVYLLLHGFAVDLTVRGGPQVSAVTVALTALFAALAGWAFLAVLERITTRPRRIWYPVALAVFLLSLLGPLGGTGTGARLGLAALHLTVAAIVVLGLPRSTRTAR